MHVHFTSRVEYLNDLLSTRSQTRRWIQAPTYKLLLHVAISAFRADALKCHPDTRTAALREIRDWVAQAVTKIERILVFSPGCHALRPSKSRPIHSQLHLHTITRVLRRSRSHYRRSAHRAAAIPLPPPRSRPFSAPSSHLSSLDHLSSSAFCPSYSPCGSSFLSRSSSACFFYLNIFTNNYDSFFSI